MLDVVVAMIAVRTLNYVESKPQSPMGCSNDLTIIVDAYVTGHTDFQKLLGMVTSFRGAHWNILRYAYHYIWMFDWPVPARRRY